MARYLVVHTPADTDDPVIRSPSDMLGLARQAGAEDASPRWLKTWSPDLHDDRIFTLWEAADACARRGGRMPSTSGHARSLRADRRGGVATAGIVRRGRPIRGRSMTSKGLMAVLASAVVALAIALPASAAPSATVVNVIAGKPSELRFTVSKKTVTKGKVTFKVANKGALEHDFKIGGKVTPKLKRLLEYQLSLHAPEAAKGSFDAAAAKRGEQVFRGGARCASCHKGDTFTDVMSGGSHDMPAWSIITIDTSS